MARRSKAVKLFEKMAADLNKGITGVQRGKTEFMRGYSTPPLERAFQLTGLDPDVPRDWQFLASVLAQSLYGATAGRPKFWDLAKLTDFGDTVALVLSLMPNATEEDVCEIISERLQTLENSTPSSDSHPAPGAKTLMRMLQEAKKKVPSLPSKLANARASQRDKAASST